MRTRSTHRPGRVALGSGRPRRTMIEYKQRGGVNFLLKFCQWRGSVFGTGFIIAFPCALVTGILRVLIDYGHLPMLGGNRGAPHTILTDNSVWSGFSFLVGFLIVFRTSQAYSRFWDGASAITKMRSEWFAACSSAIAFSRGSKKSESAVSVFQATLVRLFSLLHMLALAEIEDSQKGSQPDMDMVEAFKYELLDAKSLDPRSLEGIMQSQSKVELVYQWIQQLLVESTDSGIIAAPPPIVSRVFQELCNGLLQFHDALKISTIPFPFPYAQTCDCLLMIHWVVTPLVIAQWVSHPFWALVFSFIQVFILWCLNSIAVEIENPFGNDPNDIDARSVQQDMNRLLVQLVDAVQLQTPHLVTHGDSEAPAHVKTRSTFLESCAEIRTTTRISRTARRSDIRRSNSSNHSVGDLSAHPSASSSCCLCPFRIRRSETYTSEKNSTSWGSTDGPREVMVGRELSEMRLTEEIQGGDQALGTGRSANSSRTVSKESSRSQQPGGWRRPSGAADGGRAGVDPEDPLFDSTQVC
mmetsp:Transcript_110835/g.313629  ORF Transcript_110835/g.313629 Transcript_110835/m.313629 type:complete len:526 (+) Transcript_110835:8-1585(+)